MVDDHSVVPEALHAAISVNEAWVDSLYRDQSRRLVGLAAAITLDPGVAEEIVHDAFVGLQRRGADIANPIGYLRRSVVNLSVSRLRRRRVASRAPTSPCGSSSAAAHLTCRTGRRRFASPTHSQMAPHSRFFREQSGDSTGGALMSPCF